METRPGPDEFAALAARFNVIPIWREVTSDTLTPVGAFLRMAGTPGPDRADSACFLLESVEHGEQWGRFSFAGRNPVATLLLSGGTLQAEGSALNALPEMPRSSGILSALELLIGGCSGPGKEEMVGLDRLPPLHSGCVGYLGYDVVREVEELPAIPQDDLHVPDAVMAVIGDLAAFDHWRQRVFLIAVALVPAARAATWESSYADATRRLDTLARDLARPVCTEDLRDPPELPGQREVLESVKRRVSSGEFTAAVIEAKEHILAGDAFQIVLSQRFDLELGASPFDVYRVLRQVNPSPYMYYFRHPQVTLVGSSPEPMVKVKNRRVISRPIAGTRPRGSTEEEDRALAGELVEHPKERAEHVMLVDLARNDVGRVVEFGTEKVDELMTLERYSHVMHLTSQVSGLLKDGKGSIDVMRATLPAGTVSGAPKVSAMKIIDALEVSKRGPYAGVVGYLDFSGNMDTAITIRTMVVDGRGGASVQAGAGIVADSDPELEDRECQAKAAALLVAACAAERAAEADAGVEPEDATGRDGMGTGRGGPPITTTRR